MARTNASIGQRLASRMKSQRGTQVTWSRPGETSETITIWWGDETVSVLNPNGTIARVDSAELTLRFLAADLAMGAPEQDDRITDGGSVFEVLPIDSDPGKMWSPGTGRTVRKVRVKQVS